MWVLESSSELFQGRRMWLKPGKSYLFGRVKKDGVLFAIEHKTISRKHFILKIDDVRIEDVGNIHARTKLTIEDQNSKAGTFVNGEHIRGSSKEFNNEENYIKPGSLPEDLIIRWHPFVLTFNLLKKEIKAGVLKTKQERVKDLDIKAVSEYVIGQTTHLVVNKRNTAKSLQALINGRPLVEESFIDALEYAMTPSDLNEEENLSPLEQDFDSAWPDHNDYLPPPGREATSRPPTSYQPDARRKNVFENFIFVFLDQTQYDNLLPPITTGYGKALLYQITVGATTTEEVVAFLRNAAGKKGFGNAKRHGHKGAVILVRYKGDAGAEDWTNTLINEVSLKLDQRAIDQGEFLDAILANDGMLLRQAVPFESNQNVVAAPPAADGSPASIPLTSTSQHQDVPDTSLPSASAALSTQRSQLSINGLNTLSRHSSEPSLTGPPEQHRSVHESEAESDPIPKRARFTKPKKSRVYDFDDDFDPDAVAPYQEAEDESFAPSIPSQRQTTPPQVLSEADAANKDSPSARKRPRPTSKEASANVDNDMDDLFPAAAAMKRRKLAHDARNGVSAEPAKNKPIAALFKKVKEEKDINVREAARAQRKEQDERARKEQEDLEEDIRREPGQKLPVYDVETVLVDLPVGKPQLNGANEAATHHWDPRWNGRKNFKGFRRAKDQVNGEAGHDPRRRNHTKIIVPMVDAKTSTYGMGDQYWDRTQEEKERDREKRRKASQRTTQSQSDQTRSSHQPGSQTAHESDEEDEDEGAEEGDTLQMSPEVLRLQDEAADIVNHAVNIDEPRQTRASDSVTPTQTTTQSTRGKKRNANSGGRGGGFKKQKIIPVTVIHASASDSDDSDDMKFKFGSRRNGKGKA